MTPSTNQLSLLPAAEEEVSLTDQVTDYIRQALSSPCQPGPMELLRAIQDRFGWPSRHVFLAGVRAIRQDNSLQAYLRDYLRTALSDDAINEALRTEGRWTHEDRATLDDLFRRSQKHRHSAAFREMLDFTARFKEYAPFNNFLVRLQNPSCSFYATDKDWETRFNRSLKEDARPLLILAPMHPVMCVYELDATEGPPLPQDLGDFAAVSGEWKPERLERLIENARRDSIKVDFKPLSSTNAGFATSRVDTGSWKMRIVIHSELDGRARLAILCHELAHIHLGHLGGDKNGRWPSRLNLTHSAVELEAESAAYIACTRIGITPSSERYLAGYLKDPKILDLVSIEMIVKIAGRLEEMTEKLQDDRRAKWLSSTKPKK